PAMLRLPTLPAGFVAPCVATKTHTLPSGAVSLMMYNYAVKNVARKHGMTATFMPKLFKDNASGTHVHQSIWKGTNLFHGTQYAERSELRRFYRRIAQACLGALRAPRSNHELYVGCPVTGRRSTRLFAAQMFRLLADLRPRHGILCLELLRPPRVGTPKPPKLFLSLIQVRPQRRKAFNRQSQRRASVVQIEHHGPNGNGRGDHKISLVRRLGDRDRSGWR